MDKDKMAYIKKRLLTLEWDKKRGQINFAKTMELEELKKKLEESSQEQKIEVNNAKSV